MTIVKTKDQMKQQSRIPVLTIIVLVLFSIVHTAAGFQTYGIRSPAVLNKIGRVEKFSSFDFGVQSSRNSYDGDDLRWISRFIRRIKRRRNIYFMRKSKATKARGTIIMICLLMYMYQGVMATAFLRETYPSYWIKEPWTILSDVLLNQSVKGPLSADFLFSPTLAERQPHRYLTSGFLHSGVPHLLINMISLQRSPDWLETGLGWPLFLTTFLVGIATGNYFFAQNAIGDPTSFCLGASGGIAALHGLMFVAMSKMNNKSSASRLFNSIASLFVWGLVVPTISNSCHMGGFISGIVMGLLFSPGYTKSYSMKRKNSISFDSFPSDYRRVMGFGRQPKAANPVWILWIGALLMALRDRQLLMIPVKIFEGLLKPGSLSSLKL